MAVAVSLGLIPFSRSEFTGLNVEVLVDRSAVMNEPLSSDLTKLEAAVQAVRSQVFNERVADTDNLALRQFGGSCQSEGTQLVVPFGLNHQDDVDAALDGLTGQGDTNLTAGMVRAIGDFAQISGGDSSLIVISGGAESCQPGATQALIQQKMQEADKPITIWFIGIDVPPGDQDRLNQALSGLSANTTFVDSLGDLEIALSAIVAELQDARNRFAQGLGSSAVLPGGQPTPEPASGGSGEDQLTEKSGSGSAASTTTFPITVPTKIPINIPTTVPTPTIAPFIVKLTGPEALREGPGIEFPKTTTLNSGDTVKVVGRDKACEWLSVETSSGFGWVPSSSTTFSSDNCESIPVGNFRPLSGIIMPPSGGRGRGQLTVRNGIDTDALVILSTKNNISAAAIYIRSGEFYLLSPVPDGTYNVYFSTGEKWRAATEQFGENVRYQRFNEQFDFTTSWFIRYSKWEVTLQQAVGGNAGTVGVSESDFPKVN